MVKIWADGFLERLGPPDLLVNNAAIINANANLWEISAEIDQVIDVNLKGVANVIRRVVPAMVAPVGSRREPQLRLGPFDLAARRAVLRDEVGRRGPHPRLAQELPKGLAAVPLNPGIIDTDMLRTAFGTTASRFLNPAAWAKDAVPFLLQLGPKDNGKPLTVPGQ